MEISKHDSKRERTDLYVTYVINSNKRIYMKLPLIYLILHLTLVLLITTKNNHDPKCITNFDIVNYINGIHEIIVYLCYIPSLSCSCKV